eukprot:8634821-Pyramimonas_sp.AAC.1
MILPPNGSVQSAMSCRHLSTASNMAFDAAGASPQTMRDAARRSRPAADCGLGFALQPPRGAGAGRRNRE